MTRIAVLADIHGNLPALNAVIEDMAPFAVDRVVVAGDSINWGPFSVEVLERLTALGWAVIRGNNEMYLLDYNTERAPAHWKEFTLFPWYYQQLRGPWQHVIAAWPDSLNLRFPDAPPVRVCHASPRSHWEPLYADTSEEEIAAMLAGVEETTVIAGHTHLLMDRQVNGWHLLNPGSVGAPADGLLDASYMILDGDADGWHAAVRRVSFDYAPIFEAFAARGFYEACGPVTRLVIREIQTARPRLFAFKHWCAAHHPGEPTTDALITEFEQADLWDYLPAVFHVNRALQEPDSSIPAPVS